MMKQLADFLREAPQFEALLTRDGIHLFKIFLTIGREMQLKRLHERQHDPLKRWKLTGTDLAAIDKWDAYTEAKHDLVPIHTHNRMPVDGCPLQ